MTPASPLAGQPDIPYPPELFEQGLEGEVLLYLFVDTAGAVVRDSTRIAKSSGQTAFDAAALQGAAGLRFSPARRGGAAVAAALQVPIRFRLPDSTSARKDTVR